MVTSESWEPGQGTAGGCEGGSAETGWSPWTESGQGLGRGSEKAQADLSPETQSYWDISTRPRTRSGLGSRLPGIQPAKWTRRQGEAGGLGTDQE